VRRLVDSIQEWGGLDILVNNVSGTETKSCGFEVLSDEDWQGILDVNLLAAVRLDRAFISRHDRAQVGSGYSHLL